jgi:hypothetical protein
MNLIAHSACVGMFQSRRFVGETSSRYSGKLTESGKRQKKVKPAPNVETLMSSQVGVKVVTRMPMAKTPRTAAVRVGLRHS